MRCITYAGETVTTTDDVAEQLVELTAALARASQAEAVTIPIVFDDRDGTGEASLVVGLGNDVLSVPTDWDGDEPDFSRWAAALGDHPIMPRTFTTGDTARYAPHEVERPFDPDMDWDTA